MPVMHPETISWRLDTLLDAYPRLHHLNRIGDPLVEELREIREKARTYGERHIAPVADELDRRCGEDPTAFPWDLVRAGLPYRFLSMFIPRANGGLGYGITHMTVLMEEMCAWCPGVANIFGAHALGLSPIFMSPDIRHFDTTMREIAEAEVAGEPVLFALAITEPGAGSDVEDEEGYADARLCTVASEVPGGYRLNGRKVFISNGSVARYTWVGAVTDLSDPLSTGIGMLVPSHAQGFSVGRVEHKMGQRACPAAELIFEDVFVPTEDVVGSPGDSLWTLAAVLGASRGPVASIATGIAVGAFRRLCAALPTLKRDGEPLFAHQDVQLALADMMARIQIARSLALDATMACDELSVPRLMRHPGMKLLDKVQGPLRPFGLSRVLGSDMAYERVRKMTREMISPDQMAVLGTLSAIAKSTASELAVEVCAKAMAILGPDGPQRESGIEKLYRDARLTRIYEGTNEVNRLCAAKLGLGGGWG